MLLYLQSPCSVYYMSEEWYHSIFTHSPQHVVGEHSGGQSEANTTDVLFSPLSSASQPRRHSSLSSPTDLSPASPFSPSHSRSLLSPPPRTSTSTCESDDAISMASSASTAKFALPKFWPPAIQACIDMPSDEDRGRAMGPLIRNEVVRVLATQMFCYTMKPSKVFCTEVSKMLVKKYPFMKDKGERVSGYVSHLTNTVPCNMKYLQIPLSPPHTSCTFYFFWIGLMGEKAH